MVDLISFIFALTGVFFFFAGVLGLLRFPDVYGRLHALTKADNVGLGFIMLSVTIQADSPVLIIKLILIWLFVILASATGCFLISHAAHDMGIQPKKTGGQEGMTTT